MKTISIMADNRRRIMSCYLISDAAIW